MRNNILNVVTLYSVLHNRIIGFVITGVLIEIEELGLSMVFPSVPNCPGGPGQFGTLGLT